MTKHYTLIKLIITSPVFNDIKMTDLLRKVGYPKVNVSLEVEKKNSKAIFILKNQKQIMRWPKSCGMLPAWAAVDTPEDRPPSM